ncbi:hypothetical protein WOLCODRAFT_130434 [Wolfiporia cocos MD-104 SS10]|uniref:Mitochondrial import inner membrane translocase subunit TIM54 n=1 Tax=Wolfiporia cocos (strain MD-104) TaxID=742152 RepID=A0A2H3J668_WOLCO|nr:hypothetical protein WOLCODRAFT_130434 [Wolfiporia cocos MD-104 SS10]
MSSLPGDSVFPESNPKLTGIKAALQYTGIPPSWLDKRPKLPSRNWLIFIGVTSTVTGYYIYDRRKCREIRQEYVDKVKHLAEVPLHSLDYPRKVTVYGAKWPGDEEYDRSMKYFRKYVKPILVAAAVDYEMINGKRHGELVNRVAEDIKRRRRIDSGLESPPVMAMPLPNSSPEDKRRRELEGGIVIVGRPTFKEFMAGLKRGWTEGLEVVDKEERLSQVLESDGHFDEPEQDVDAPADSADVDGEPIPTASRLPPSKSFSAFTPPHLRAPSPQPPSAPSSEGSSIPASLNAPPASIPSQPPLLLVHFVNHIGLSQIPYMIWDFFNERARVLSGAEAAYRLIVDQTRPFDAPPPEALAQLHETASQSSLPPPPSTATGTEIGADTDATTDISTSPARPHFAELAPSDLDFDRDAEEWYKKSTVRSFASEIAKARESYYKALSERLATARSLARGTREPTKDERNYPPPTEVELRAERMKKELRWRADEEGWETIRPDNAVAWDERFRSALKVFVDPPSDFESTGNTDSSTQS